MREGFIARAYKVLRWRGARIAALKTLGFLGIPNLLIRVDTNNLCNLRCQMCPEVAVRSSKGFKPVIMRLDDFKRVASQIFSYAHVLYLSCAGEPFMTPGFAEYLKVTASYRVPFISFATHGMRIDEEIVDTCINRRVSQITISADGARRVTFESIRTGASFERLLKKLALIRNHKRAAGSKLPEVRLNYVLCKSNWQEVLEFVELAHEYGANSVQFRPLTPFENTPWSRANQLDPGDENALAELLIKAQEKCAAYGIKLLGHSEFTGKGLEEKGSIVDTCVYPWYYRYIAPSGAMRICPSRKPVGNLLEKSYAEIMGSVQVRSLKEDVLHRSEACRLQCAPGTSSAEL